MKKVMDFYNICLDKERKSIDDVMIKLINNDDLMLYAALILSLNVEYANLLIINDLMKEINKVYKEDLDTYLSIKLKCAEELFYFDPITIELVNNTNLYYKHLFPLSKVSKEQYFTSAKKIFDKNINLFRTLIINAYRNYKNPYLEEVFMYYFNLLLNIQNYPKLSNEDINLFANFLIERNCKHYGINTNFENLTLAKKITRSYRLTSKIFLALKSVLEYKKTLGICSDDLICIYHTNMSKPYYHNKIYFYNFLEVLFHEIKHRLEIVTPLEKNMRAREMLLTKLDYYHQNHDYFGVEANAEIYALRNREYITKKYFSDIYKENSNIDTKILKYETYKYKKVNYIEQLIDETIRNNPSVLNDELKKEYEIDGTPKNVFQILYSSLYIKNEDELSVYYEMIIRALNRLNENNVKDVYDVSINALEYFVIRNAVSYKIKEIQSLIDKINDYYDRKIINDEEKNRLYSNININYYTRLYFYQELFCHNKEKIR